MAIEDFLALTAKMGDEHKELRGQLENTFKDLNQEAGKAKSDLNEFKTENQKLKDLSGELQTKNSSYAELLKALNDANIDLKEAPKLAEKLRIKKNADDEMVETKALLEALGKENKELKASKALQELKDVLLPKFDVARKEFKNKDGEGVQVSDKFLDMTELLKPIDINSETLVNDRFSKVLEKAHTEQTNFMKETGMDFVNGVHNTPEGGDRHFQGKPELDRNKLFEHVAKEHGSVDSVAAGIAAIRQEKNNQ